ncbi:hypothetical protein VTK56DRAFT_2698 [Thermocarpiscus australiensis]
MEARPHQTVIGGDLQLAMTTNGSRLQIPQKPEQQPLSVRRRCLISQKITLSASRRPDSSVHLAPQPHSFADLAWSLAFRFQLYLDVWRWGAPVLAKHDGSPSG